MEELVSQVPIHEVAKLAATLMNEDDGKGAEWAVQKAFEILELVAASKKARGESGRQWLQNGRLILQEQRAKVSPPELTVPLESYAPNDPLIPYDIAVSNLISRSVRTPKDQPNKFAAFLREMSGKVEIGVGLHKRLFNLGSYGDVEGLKQDGIPREIYWMCEKEIVSWVKKLNSATGSKNRGKVAARGDATPKQQAEPNRKAKAERTRKPRTGRVRNKDKDMRFADNR